MYTHFMIFNIFNIYNLLKTDLKPTMCIKIKLQPQTNVSTNFASPLYYKHRKVAHRRVQWRGTTWEYLFNIYEMID